MKYAIVEVLTNWPPHRENLEGYLDQGWKIQRADATRGSVIYILEKK